SADGALARGHGRGRGDLQGPRRCACGGAGPGPDARRRPRPLLPRDAGPETPVGAATAAIAPAFVPASAQTGTGMAAIAAVAAPTGAAGCQGRPGHRQPLDYGFPAAA